jgi:hypothetical protein
MLRPYTSHITTLALAIRIMHIDRMSAELVLDNLVLRQAQDERNIKHTLLDKS